MAAKNIDSFPGQVEVTSNLTVDTNTLHVDSITGRVGMGKTDPGYTVDVNGTLNATSLYVGGSEFTGGGVWTESGSDIYYTGGNVGIGVTNPAKKLDVAGPLRITDGGTAVSDLSTGVSPFGFQSKVTAPDPGPADRLGWSVSVSGDGSYAIAGAYLDDDTFPNSGSAYIYARSGSTWSHQAKIVAPDPQPAVFFGRSVSISGDGSYALVGVERDVLIVDDEGSAHIFNRSGSTWSHQAKLTAPDVTSYKYFAGSVSISGDGSYAIAGAYGDTSRRGAAYIYTRSGSSWTYQSKITAPDGAPNYRFGTSVAISGDGSYAIVGAYFTPGPAGTPEPAAGAAYIYARSGSTWSYQQKITAPDATTQGRFGRSVSISSDGSYALSGAHGYSTPTNPTGDYGGAYIFNRSGSTWTFQSKVTAPDPNPAHYLGQSVSISDDGSTVISGAFGDNNSASSSGAAYIFGRSGSTWSFQQKIKAPDPAAFDMFGYSVSISGDGLYTFVGSYKDDDIQTDSGSAYIYNASLVLAVSTPIEADGTLLSFTGQHICFPEGPMEQGLVVSANKNKYVSLNGSLTTGSHAVKSSEALPVVSLSNVANDPSVFGVVDHFEQNGTTRSQTSGATVIEQDKEIGDNRVVVNSLGEGAIWVANTNGNVVSGDFLTTSDLPGYAQRQSDNDTLLNYTVAKSTMDCDFEPEDLPVQVILKDDDGNNVLDSYGRLQWVDSDRTEPEYRIRYLDVSGTPTDEANAVHRAAFVGCTYHCG